LAPAALFPAEERTPRQADVWMRETRIEVGEETSGKIVRPEISLLEASKRYITVFLIMTILLSVWAGLCAT
jgi:hypothetical protein